MTTMNLIQSECVIDHQDLLTRCMGNKQFAARILDAFLRQLTVDLEELDEAIRAEDPREIAVIAHRVKGSSSTVSARRLNMLATSMGELAKNRDLERLQSCNQAIREEHLQFGESAKQFARCLLLQSAFDGPRQELGESVKQFATSKGSC